MAGEIMAMYAVGQGVPTMANVLRVLQAKGILALDPRYTDETEPMDW